jgi:long-chain acyl-CoA synthetase
MKTIPDMIQKVARENAARIAIVEGQATISYEELWRRIKIMAQQLSECGVRKGDSVGLLLPNSADFVTSYFAIVTLGAIVVPLNDHYQRNDLLYFLKACNISYLVTSLKFAPLCNEVLVDYDENCISFYVDSEEVLSNSRLDRFMGEIEVDPLSPVMYQFSSGSTGTPKKIARTHNNLILELASLHKTLQVTNEDRFLGVAPFSHVNGMMRSMMNSISAGAALYPVADFKRYAVAELIAHHQISVFIAVPFMFSMLAEANYRTAPDFSSLRYCISASAPMPIKSNHQFFEKFGRHIRQLYGSTETGTISVNLQPEIGDSLESVGTPLHSVEVTVVTEKGTSAEPGEMGELVVKSPFMISGYEGLDEVNRKDFREGCFFTGDLGKRGHDGLLYLLGRKKFFINKGGYKIDPRQIEEVLEAHPHVKEVVAVGVPTAYGDEKVKAVIVVSEPCTESEMVEFCRGKIADFKIPSIVEFRESLPKSPTGKIRRKLLVDGES